MTLLSLIKYGTLKGFDGTSKGYYIGLYINLKWLIILIIYKCKFFSHNDLYISV